MKTEYSRPIEDMPWNDWNDAPMCFGARRDSGKRKHAGIDIYAPVGTPVLSIARGQVVREQYLYYRGTMAIEIRIDTGEIIRYCEMGTVKSTLTMGAILEAGEQIGTVGKIPGIKASMLHLEMYTGTDRGPLTDYDNPPYMRRTDLINPTELINKIYNVVPRRRVV